MAYILLCVAVTALIIVSAIVQHATSLSESSSSGKSTNLWQQTKHVTPKFAAEHNEHVLNVHIVPHTHDDVGWLKTVEQYYYGRNNTIQRAAVRYILSTVMMALEENPNRTFTYVEQKFFSMWWTEQSNESKQRVRRFIANNQLAFVNGGWCMHDEATTHFMGMIDQTTLGHSFLKRELGVIPTIGWQLDPFGHSATQASLLTYHLGFDALYFGRIDHQDLRLRRSTRECEGLWESSSSNLNTTVFWGLTGSYEGNYGAPNGFCFDVNCQDEPLIGDDDEHLLERVADFVHTLQVQSNQTKGNHIMLTMGSDFNYQEALVNFENLDLLISSILKYQASGKINVPALFGPRFERLNVFYSNPEYYTKCKHTGTSRAKPSSLDKATGRAKYSGDVDWSVKKDDFFPYSDCPHCFWTGYFTSRASFKRLERVGSSFLQVARQIESMHDSQTKVGLGDCHCLDPLLRLDDAMGVAQHHDAVSGTAKQHVANDYAKRVQGGIDEAARFVADKLKQFLLNESDIEHYLKNLAFCQLLNETHCDVSAKAKGQDLYVVVYNGLAQTRSTVVGLPISFGSDYRVMRLDGLETSDGRRLQSNVLVENGGAILYFDTGPLPPVGGVVFRISLGKAKSSPARRSMFAKSDQRTEVLSNGVLSVHFNSSTGMIQYISNLVDGSIISIQQDWGYYTSFDSSRDQSPDKAQQNSSAYIFRPSQPSQELVPIRPAAGKASFVRTSLGGIAKAKFEDSWMTQTTRLFDKKPFVEVEYTIGPIPIDDGLGKEIVARFCTPIQSAGLFYTDSNGREFLKRTRGARPTWPLTEFEPVAGNYYPVNAAIYIEDKTTSFSIVVDRSQGGSSLKDGCIELMVQRRTLADDARGVGEAMNETVGGMTPYPPYGKAERMGDGVVIKGTHRIIVGKGKSGASLARSQMDGAFSEPLVFVASTQAGSRVPFRRHSFTALNVSLPSNVMLVTFKLLHEAPSTTFLIRLGHQYAADESRTLSHPAQVDVRDVLTGWKVMSMTEKTLSGNQDYVEWQKRRLKWTRDDEKSVHQGLSSSEESFMIELKPMEIRTFEVRVEAVKER